jgi:hypothetical protein
LSEHAESIGNVSNIGIKDFYCRFLVVDDIWIPLGESLLIAKFSPIWNNIIDGFGNHDPGKGRYEGMRPRWDVLHPGRAWAAKCKSRPETPEQIVDDNHSSVANNSLRWRGSIELRLAKRRRINAISGSRNPIGCAVTSGAETAGQGQANCLVPWTWGGDMETGAISSAKKITPKSGKRRH